eukprot:7158655-Prymnesium_polylepis.1
MGRPARAQGGGGRGSTVRVGALGGPWRGGRHGAIRFRERTRCAQGVDTVAASASAFGVPLSSVSWSRLMALEASRAEPKVTRPQPLERPVPGSSITSAWTTWPACVVEEGRGVREGCGRSEGEEGGEGGWGGWGGGRG